MSTCRGCGAPIVWGIAEHSGKRVPIDPAPRDDGNITFAVLTEPGGEPVSGDIINVGAKGPGKYVSHFVTCPVAKAFRRKP